MYVATRRAGCVVLPIGIPDDPERQYESQFLGWADFLGTHLRPIIPFNQALNLVARMGFTTLTQWKSYFRGHLVDAMPIPSGISAYPDLDYQLQFRGYNDWFNRYRKTFRGIRYAKEFVHPLPIANEQEWWAYVLGRFPHLPPLPDDIPMMPSLVFGRYWQGFDNFLNPKVDYLSFAEARKYVRQLGLRSIGEWRDYAQGELPFLSRKPDNIPAHPEKVYAEFISYVDWLFPEGKRWRPYESASYYVSQFNFETMDEFKVWRRGGRPDLPTPPEDIPKTPSSVYRDQWASSHEFLNDGRPRFRSFEEAKQFLRPLGLRTTIDWKMYCDGKFPDLPPKPKDIPTNPFEVYFEEYEGIHDFLGVFCY